MHPDLLWSALALYALGIGLALPSMARGRPALTWWALAALASGLALNSAALVQDALYLHRLPLTNVETALSFLAFCVAAAFFLIYLRYRITWPGILVLPFAFALTLAAALTSGATGDSAAMRSLWLTLHGLLMLLGYAGLFLTFVAAVMYLAQSGELKSKQPKALYFYLPPLEVCDRLYDQSLLFGLVCMSAGILTGFLWASRVWSGFWEIDPKILASVFTWIIYLVLASTRVRGSWGGRRSAYVAILGFAAVMVTFLGASFLSSQHGYFPTIGRMR
jgi:ABC-type uncharacterized transport system permease subunit